MCRQIFILYLWSLSSFSHALPRLAFSLLKTPRLCAFLWSGCKCFVSKLICFKIFQRNGEKYVFLLPIGHRLPGWSRRSLEPKNHVNSQFIFEIVCEEFVMLNYSEKNSIKFRKAVHYVRGFENNFSTRTFPQTPPNQAPFHNSPIYYTNRIFVRETFQAPNPRNSRQESTPPEKSDTLSEQSFAFWRTSSKAFKAWQRWKFFFAPFFALENTRMCTF